MCGINRQLRTARAEFVALARKRHIKRLTGDQSMTLYEVMYIPQGERLAGLKVLLREGVLLLLRSSRQNASVLTVLGNHVRGGSFETEFAHWGGVVPSQEWANRIIAMHGNQQIVHVRNSIALDEPKLLKRVRVPKSGGLVTSACLFDEGCQEWTDVDGASLPVGSQLDWKTHQISFARMLGEDHCKSFLEC